VTAFKNPLQLTQILPQLQQQFGQTPAGVQLLQVLLVYVIQGSFLLGVALMAAACVVNFFLKEVPLQKSFAQEASPAQATAATSPEGPYAIGVGAARQHTD
jgi:hypothetical protein